VYEIGRCSFWKPRILLAAVAAALFLGVAARAYVPVIDPGHGGEDGGAVADGGIVESKINLDISIRLKHLFCLIGTGPVMVRESDISLHDKDADTLRRKKVSDLKNRVALVNSVDDAFLISIHQNSYPESRYRGAHVFYSSEESKPLAEMLQKRLRDLLDPGNRREAKKVPSSVYLMKHVSCPAILVECGFLTNPQELQLLRDPKYQKKLALVIAATYLDFVRDVRITGR
jgi:N-acetylmuramoyl-L-alanine amidase